MDIIAETRYSNYTLGCAYMWTVNLYVEVYSSYKQLIVTVVYAFETVETILCSMYEIY